LDAGALMVRRPRVAADRRRGATLVEFALSFLLFVVMLVGLVEASRMVWAYTTLANAARRGARFVLVQI
jgi:Flp pilus assembly protein TadG